MRITESFLLLKHHKQQEPDEESTFRELKRERQEILGLSFPAQESTKKDANS